MNEKLRNFFSGRNGMDALSSALSWTAVIVMLVSGFIGIDRLRSLLYYLS